MAAMASLPCGCAASSRCACYIGFTGTPLLKKEKNTLSTFGGLIHKYAIDEAVADEAVVPLLYEGRMVEQQISGRRNR